MLTVSGEPADPSVADLFDMKKTEELTLADESPEFQAMSNVSVDVDSSSSRTTMITVTSSSRCGFVETLWIQRLLPLNISLAVHPQVVRTTRFNMDDYNVLSM